MKEENINENAQPQMMSMNMGEQNVETTTMNNANVINETPEVKAPTMNTIDENKETMINNMATENVEQPTITMSSLGEHIEPVAVTNENVSNEAAAVVAPTMNTIEQTVPMMSDLNMNVTENAQVVTPVVQPEVITEPTMNAQTPIMESVNAVEMTNPNAMMNNSTPTVKQLQGDGKKSNKGKIIITSILLAIVVIGLGVFGFIMYKNYNNPRNRLLKSLEKYTEKNNIIADTNNMTAIMKKGANLKLDGTLKVKVGEQEYVNGKLNMKYIDNPTQKQQYYDIVLSNNDEQIGDIEGILKDSKLYFQLKEVFEKFYFIEDIDYDKLTELSKKDTKKLEANITNTMLQYFSEEKFKSEKEKITINGSSKNTMKITITMSEKDMGELFKLFFTNLLNDPESLNLMVSEDLTLEEVKKSFQSSIDSINEYSQEMSTEPIFTYIANLDGYEIVKQIIAYNEYKLTIEGMETGKIAVNVGGTDIATGAFSKNNLKTNIIIDESTTVALDITYQEKITPTNVDANYNILVSADIAGVKCELSSIITMKVDNQNTIPNVDLSNAKSIEDITEKEIEDIKKKIMTLPVIGDLITDYNERVNETVKDPDYGLEDFNNEYNDMFNEELPEEKIYVEEKCNTDAFACVDNEDGTMACKYFDDNFEEQNITCTKVKSNNKVSKPTENRVNTIIQ